MILHMRKIELLFILFLAVLTACGTIQLIQPSQIDVERGSQKYPGLTLADLNKGKLIYEQECVICHRLKGPASRSEAKWKKIVPRMVKKVNKKKGRVAINPESEEILLKYLITMSEHPRP